METNFSKSRIDRLGQNLKNNTLSVESITELDNYRRSYGKAYSSVIKEIEDKLRLNPSGRPAKSTNSIIEKLKRETIRLSQIQDIAGCRIVVTDIREQEKVIKEISEIYPNARIIDRRIQSSSGYRAVHIVPQINGYLVEIQIRTEFQHKWAEISEKLSDQIDRSIKYGGGPKKYRHLLNQTTNLILTYEELFLKTSQMETILPIQVSSLEKLKDSIYDVLITFVEVISSEGKNL